MLKHSKAGLQCRCFFWVNLFETSKSPLANPGNLTITIIVSGEFDHNLVGVGNLNQKCQVNFFQMMRDKQCGSIDAIFRMVRWRIIKVNKQPVW